MIILLPLHIVSHAHAAKLLLVAYCDGAQQFKSVWAMHLVHMGFALTLAHPFSVVGEMLGIWAFHIIASADPHLALPASAHLPHRVQWQRS